MRSIRAGRRDAALASIAAASMSIVLAAQLASAGGPPAPVNVRVVNTPLAVAGSVTGTVSVDPTLTITLLEMIGLPMNFQTSEPLDTSSCGALRIILKSPASGPSLLFSLVDSATSTSYFSELVPAEESWSGVVELPAPTSDVVMGVSGACPGCALAIYCR